MENNASEKRPLESGGLTDLLSRLGDSLDRMDALMNAPPVVRLPIPPLKPITIWPVSMPDVPDDVSDDLYEAARDEAMEADMKNEAHVGGGGHATAD